jgi:RNA recognition motif-containing protein
MADDYAATSSVLLVRGLSFNVRSAHIEEIFSTFGKVSSVDVLYRNGHCAGCALVVFGSRTAALNAIAEMDYGNIDGIEISVTLADPRKPIEHYSQEPE